MEYFHAIFHRWVFVVGICVTSSFLFSQCPPTADAGANVTIQCGESIEIGSVPPTVTPPMSTMGCSSASSMTVNPAGGAYINSVTTTGGLTMNINNTNTLVDGDNPQSAYIAFNRWYSDFTNQLVDGVQGGSFLLNLQGNRGATGSNPPLGQFRIWIDWGNNGSFNNTNERVYTSATLSSNPFNDNNILINIPPDAAIGVLRMRIRVKYGAPFVDSDASCTKSNPQGWAGSRKL